MTVTDIRAAGGLLWRPAAGDADAPDGIEVAVIHRGRHDDWSLPKGKLDPHEEPLLAAVREVGEETGRAVSVGRHLAMVRYDVGNRAKAVRYWAMRDTGPLGTGEITDTDEVAALEWLSPSQASARLTYPDDRKLLAGFERVPRADAVVALVRHAHAGKRSQWHDADELRPLDGRGLGQAAALAGLLVNFGPTAVFAADRLRCAQTVEPLAQRLGVTTAALPEVSDEAYLADPAAAVAAVERVAGAAAMTVVCSQGTAIPGMLDRWLPPPLRATRRSLDTRKAAWWVIGLRAGSPVWLDRYDRPATTRTR